jgi:hypothetical protein
MNPLLASPDADPRIKQLGVEVVVLESEEGAGCWRSAAALVPHSRH